MYMNMARNFLIYRVESIKYLDPHIKYGTLDYFGDLVTYLEKEGYKDLEDMFAAPFDFRKGPEN